MWWVMSKRYVKIDKMSLYRSQFDESIHMEILDPILDKLMGEIWKLKKIYLLSCSPTLNRMGRLVPLCSFVDRRVWSGRLKLLGWNFAHTICRYRNRSIYDGTHPSGLINFRRAGGTVPIYIPQSTVVLAVNLMIALQRGVRHGGGRNRSQPIPSERICNYQAVRSRMKKPTDGEFKMPKTFLGMVIRARIICSWSRNQRTTIIQARVCEAIPHISRHLSLRILLVFIFPTHLQPINGWFDGTKPSNCQPEPAALQEKSP